MSAAIMPTTCEGAMNGRRTNPGYHQAKMPSLIRLLATYLRPYAGPVILVVSLLLIQSIANLYLPNLNADIINNGVVKGDVGYIWGIGAIMLGLAVIVGILAIVAVYFSSRSSMGFGRDVRRAVFERVQQITGVRVIRAFNRIPYERDRFAAVNADLTATALRVNRIFAVALPALLAIMNLSSVAVVWFGGHLIDSGQMPVGNLIAFLAYILQIMFAVMMAVFILIFIPRAIASAGRLEAVLQTQPSITDPADPIEPGAVTGTVEFQDVTFGYPGGEKPVLHELSFQVRPGATTAIIGGTGSGKTTLLNLIPRFFDVTAGTVSVNDVDVRKQPRETLWHSIGLVPQQAYLFRGTIADNLRFGRDEATEAELWHALEVAQAREFVAAMPGQLEAPVDQGGTNLSGGQRQRLAIARALVRRPPLYLFDDCFSALDAGTDARLRSALKSEARDAALVIVAQRVSTILAADQIIVLDAGRIVGIGTHQDLMSTTEAYREIVASQLGEEAVA